MKRKPTSLQKEEEGEQTSSRDLKTKRELRSAKPGGKGGEDSSDCEQQQQDQDFFDEDISHFLLVVKDHLNDKRDTWYLIPADSLNRIRVEALIKQEHEIPTFLQPYLTPKDGKWNEYILSNQILDLKRLPSASEIMVVSFCEKEY